jgi:YihY family inner membrane protein
LSEPHKHKVPSPGELITGSRRAARVFRAAVFGLVKAVRDGWHGFFERRVPMMAAGLGFYFLLGLIPFLFIMAAISGYFLKNNPGIYEQVTITATQILPPGIGEDVMAQIQSASKNWKGLGALGLVSLIFVAMGLFDALDEGINAVMGAKKKVGFLTGRIISLAYVVGAIVFFSLAATAGYTIDLFKTLPFFQEHPGIVLVLGRYFSEWVFAVFLLALYMTLPVKTPKLIQAVVIALAVAGAWSVLQKLGTVITAGITRRQAIYGALAGAAVFLTWMYLLAILILMGARILDFWRSGDEDTPASPANT